MVDSRLTEVKNRTMVHQQRGRLPGVPPLVAWWRLLPLVELVSDAVSQTLLLLLEVPQALALAVANRVLLRRGVPSAPLPLPLGLLPVSRLARRRALLPRASKLRNLP
jgi:hypothetical protein